jgi:hypothetical protein
MEAEAAAGVTLAAEVVFDGDGAFGGLGLGVEQGAVEEVGGEGDGEGERERESEEGHFRTGWKVLG